MFNLAYPLESHIFIDEKKFKVDMSFDNILRLYDLLDDPFISEEQQIEVGLEMLIGKVSDLTIRKKAHVIKQIFDKLIHQGKRATVEENVDIQGNPMPIEKKGATFSLVEDASYIYASFFQDYGVNLFEQQGKLDWREFLALLDGLSEKTRIKEIIEIRTMDLPKGKGMEKQRQKILKMKEIYKLASEPSINRTN
ncbi:Gp15 family bacteriophage protein [Alkalihalobacillus trypoxylicola]|uniref:Bacteriophage Gp15 protein n=1 Tax=Alkalihalobacillus trypoxylicola TaxID=519424 RepID=A0A162DNV0_9BACI|nr:Gp15 family bacteriophage protein [Alkalihalobacillus trypoxylicola]KYG30422.1 hypothetical protein AZF04_19860 [Alkalihalobacillus trypoxylicola]